MVLIRFKPASIAHSPGWKLHLKKLVFKHALNPIGSLFTPAGSYFSLSPSISNARLFSRHKEDETDVTCIFSPKQLSLKFYQGNREVFKEINYSWLRDNCSCENCLHPLTKQKLIRPESMIDNIKPLSSSFSNKKINIVWPEIKQGAILQHPSEYSLDWILESLQSPVHLTTVSKDPYDSQFPIASWKGSDLSKQEVTFDFEGYMKDDIVFKDVLQTLNKYGICFLSGVEKNQNSVTKVASKIGLIYNTFYGVEWDVKNDPNAANIAYTALDLGLHMDLLYFESPPGIQLLHCLENEVEGGDSVFVDGQTSLKILGQENPEHYATLSRVPVTFQYNNNGHHLEYRRSTIYEDQLGQHHLFYSPPFMGPLDIHGLSSSDIGKFHSGFRTLAQIINRPDLVYKTRLLPGDMVLFNNRRVLHGRTAFYPLDRMRHFKGTYVGMDVFKDRLRTIQR